MKAQIENFQKVVQVLQQTLGQHQTKDKITTSIFNIVTANNDLFAHYFATGAANATLNEQFIDNLVDRFIQHLTVTYILFSFFSFRNRIWERILKIGFVHAVHYQEYP